MQSNELESNVVVAMLWIGTNLCFIFVLTVHFAASDVNRIELPESSRMVGVDTIHDVKIDKDTIISQNLKLEKRKSKSGKYDFGDIF